MLSDALQLAVEALVQFLNGHGQNVASFEVRALFAVILVSLVCGAVSPLVVGTRMAFFSDAQAHCAWAGVTLGLLTSVFFGTGTIDDHLTVLVMIGFGALVAVGIAFVREKTSLASDTVIGVFFAGAVGFGAILFSALAKRTILNPEVFMFGSPIFVGYDSLARLVVLGAVVLALLVFGFNSFIFASFNPSLARSRGIALRVQNYAFIVLLALVVNLSVRTVGVLLINGLLIVPGATANNLARNLRQMFWLSVVLSVLTGVAGLLLSMTVQIPLKRGHLEFGASGTILVLSVSAFFLSMIVPRLLCLRPA